MATKQNPQTEASSTSPRPEDQAPTNAVSEIVIYKKRKKKRGSSRSSRRLEDIENRATKSLRRVTKAVDRGVKIYREKRDKSERKRRDGALVDFYENAAVGMSETIAQASPALSDLARAFNTRRRRKNIRRLIGSFPVPR
jgi:ribosomal protein L14